MLLTSGWSDTSRGRSCGKWDLRGGLDRGLEGGLGGGLGGRNGSEAAANKGLHSGSAGPGGCGRCAHIA